MHRRRSLLCDVFQIDLHTKPDENTLAGSYNESTSSDFTVDDDGYTILPPPVSNNNSDSRFMRSHSLDVTSLNNSAASRGVSIQI